MEIRKRNDTFDSYTCDVSRVELEALRDGLAGNHSGPVKDSMYQALCWYFDHLPGPGEDKETVKARDDAAKKAGATGAVPPKPPGEGGGEGGAQGGEGEGPVDLDQVLPEPKDEEPESAAPRHLAGNQEKPNQEKDRELEPVE